MKKTIVVFLILSLSFSLLTAQQNPALTEAFQRNFTRGSLSTKIEVLQDSMSYNDVDMSPLYLLSLDFVTRNAPILANDSQSRELASLTVRLIRVAEITTAADELWSLFNVYDDVVVQREILSTLGAIAEDDQAMIENLNKWVDGRNNLFRTGQPVNLDLLGEALTALGKIGDESSFPVIFASAMMGYPVEIKQKAEEALHQVSGDYRRMVSSILENSPIVEKLYVLQFVQREQKISDEDRSWIALRALQIALDLTPQGAREQEMIFQLQGMAVSLLNINPDPETTPELIRHFDTALLAWEREMVPVSYLIAAIDALGYTGTHEAAERLTLYLELLNLYTENGQTVNSQVVTALIRNLGLLGDKISFDYLLYVRYLNYPEEVKEAAREALENLRRE